MYFVFYRNMLNFEIICVVKYKLNFGLFVVSWFVWGFVCLLFFIYIELILRFYVKR